MSKILFQIGVAAMKFLVFGVWTLRSRTSLATKLSECCSLVLEFLASSALQRIWSMHQAESRPVLALFISGHDAQVSSQCSVDAACKLTRRKLYSVKKLAHFAYATISLSTCIATLHPIFSCNCPTSAPCVRCARITQPAFAHEGRVLLEYLQE